MTSMFISNGRNLIKSLNTGQILAGLDLGDKTIGIAISDRNLSIGSPIKTIARKGGYKDLESLRNFVNEFKIGGFILGLPLSLNGEENERTKKTRDFGDKLSSYVELDVYLQDERFSSDVIYKEMKKGSLSNKKINKYINQSSAAYILQGFLDKYRY